jgi:hypothetical protein
VKQISRKLCQEVFEKKMTKMLGFGCWMIDDRPRKLKGLLFIRVSDIFKFKGEGGLSI